MESKISPIQESDYSKQCESEKVIEISDAPLPIEKINKNSIYENVSGENGGTSEVRSLFDNSEVQDEPIDLTFVRADRIENMKIQKAPVNSNATRIIIQPKKEIHLSNMTDPLLSGRGCKRKNEMLNMRNDDLVVPNWSPTSTLNAIPQNFIIPESNHSQSKATYSYAIVHSPQQDLAGHLTTRQQEILKMAKSIFSKRTRTLYHWMYPTASKQQIKQVVSNTWDSMAAQEKNIYIAQVLLKAAEINYTLNLTQNALNFNKLRAQIVLGRFGYANANLMVNPQLGQIKEIPPMPGIQEFNPKASELQNAISSIRNETENIEEPCASTSLSKKAKGTKKKLAQNLSGACSEFDDDPELCQELAQFSMMFKNQF